MSIDGTLIDSEPLHLEALLAVCDHHKVDNSDLAQAASVGVNLIDVWERLGNRFRVGLTRDSWIDQINHYYAGHCHGMSVFPGAVDVVKTIHRIGLPQVAVSNSNRIVVDTNLIVLGLSGIMAGSLSLDDVAPFGKPDPLTLPRFLIQL
jgi:beta-phosphoglucomutase-like phosphatase (HAD superfamily)